MAIMGHNSDLKDSPQYIKRQVWGEQIFVYPHSRRFRLVRTMLEACSIVYHDSAHPTYLELHNLYTLYSLGCRSNLSCEVLKLTGF